MRPSVALIAWSLCWSNSVCVSFVNMGSRRKASSGPQDRPIMFVSCRVHLTGARSQSLTGEAVEGRMFCTIYNQCWCVKCKLCLLQYHRCPHSGITAKTVHKRAARAYNPILQIHTFSLLCSDAN